MDKGAENYIRYLDGDDTALELLVRDYKDGLILYLCGILRDVNTAEDICEDAFFRLITKRPAFTGEASFKTWLYRIARNLAYDELKRKKPDVNVDDLEIPSELLPHETLEKRERDAAVRRTVEKLEPLKREAISLVYFEEMSVADAARIMGKSQNAVSLILMRGKADLKELLIKEGITNEDI